MLCLIHSAQRIRMRKLHLLRLCYRLMQLRLGRADLTLDNRALRDVLSKNW